jgi:hypothetical protein
MLKAVTTPAPPVQIQSEVIDISPEFAAELLENKNTRNRPLTRSTVLAYAKEMRNGNWTITHQGIALDTEGVLLDGQHRLAAVVEAGVTIPLMVSYDLPPETFATVDTGRRRTATDALSMAGLGTNRYALAALAKFLTIHENRATVSPGSNKANRMTNQEVIDAVLRFGQDELLESLNKTTATARALNSNVTALSAFYYLAVNSAEVDAEEIRAQFLEPLRAGIGFNSATDPRLVLRNRLMKESGTGNTDATRMETFSLIVHGWNSYREGRKLTRIIAPRDVPAILAA